MAKKAKKSRKRKERKPPPQCKALLLCEKTIIEAVTGKVSIIGVFDTFNAASLPTLTNPFTVFIQLTDGIGRYDIVVEVHDLQYDAMLGQGKGLGLNWPEKLLKMNVMIPVPSLRVVHAGSYDLVVFANGQEIDRQVFVIATIDKGEDDDVQEEE